MGACKANEAKKNQGPGGITIDSKWRDALAIVLIARHRTASATGEAVSLSLRFFRLSEVHCDPA